MEPGAPPDLRDVEQKLGRKVPESLARPLRGEELPAAAAPGPRRRRAAALARLEAKLHLLRQEMVTTEAVPLSLMGLALARG
ncbi:leucine rich adaptor protein 1-like isoform X2 [Opisthocomus hoazin]|uniref:leucine rich adaptor protein 1-like isoform X2 n=1 Tax=Opisthocomus hoazin TaxID=30419 RepID=UPI003F538B35